MRKIVWRRGVPGLAGTRPRRADVMSPSNSRRRHDVDGTTQTAYG
ncbi:hypothetical protein [Streptomyces sp. NPDC086766]